MSHRGRDFRWKPQDGSGPKTPSWKETYRQAFLKMQKKDDYCANRCRCLDRLRESRFKHLLTKRRSGSPTADDGNDNDAVNMNRQDRREKIVQDIQAMMTSEWEMIHKEDAAEKGVVPDDIPAPSVDEMIALMEDILGELRQEKSDLSLMDDFFCEEYAQREEEELCQAFHRMSAVEVICPICQKDSLQEVSGLISCTCGLRINTEQDCISLKNVADSLQSGTDDHDLQCDRKPSFSQMDDFGINTLIMTCQECDFHYIIV